MGVTLTQEEIDEALASSRTCIVTSLRKDGMPVSVPMWFAYIDGSLYFRTPGQAKKVKRLDNDQRVCFLVESGEVWAELKAVMITGRVEVIEDDDMRATFEAAMAAKYSTATTPREKMPDATKKHYTANRSRIYRIVPEEGKRPVTWDNKKIRLRT